VRATPDLADISSRQPCCAPHARSSTPRDAPRGRARSTPAPCPRCRRPSRQGRT
jgi:hypothetical protein